MNKFTNSNSFEFKIQEETFEENIEKIKKYQQSNSNDYNKKDIEKIYKGQLAINSFWLLLTTILFLSSVTAVLIFLFSNFFEKVEWTWYIIPAVVGIVSLIKMIIAAIEKSAITKGMKSYINSLKFGEKILPNFLFKYYKQLVLKQISHIWVTIFVLFYGSLFTGLLYSLKDVVVEFAGITINFKQMILTFIPNTNLFFIVAISFMAIFLSITIFFWIWRKKKILDVENIIGIEASVKTDIQNIKRSRNKSWIKLFIFSIFVISVLPIIILLILKRFIAGRKK